MVFNDHSNPIINHDNLPIVNKCRCKKTLRKQDQRSTARLSVTQCQSISIKQQYSVSQVQSIKYYKVTLSLSLTFIQL